MPPSTSKARGATSTTKKTASPAKTGAGKTGAAKTGAGKTGARKTGARKTNAGVAKAGAKAASKGLRGGNASANASWDMDLLQRFENMNMDGDAGGMEQQYNQYDQVGGSVLGQSLHDLAVPFGLVLAKTGFEAWRSSRKSPKPKAPSTKKASALSSRGNVRRRVAVGGGASDNDDMVSQFQDMYDSINAYVESTTKIGGFRRK